jgi:hypothetical protein
MIKFKTFLRKKGVLFPFIILDRIRGKWFVKRFQPCLRFLLIGFLLVLTGCNTSLTSKLDPTLIDISFSTGQPCKPPCWQGLELNESTTDQVYEKLAELPFVYQGSIKTWNNVTLFGFSDATMISYKCNELKGEICGTLVISDGLLKVSSHRIQYHLPLQSVIDKLGEPNYVIYSPYTSHGDGCMADLDWQEKNIFVRIIDSNTQLCHEIQVGESLDPNIGVTEVYYLVKEAFIPNQCQEYNCVPWPGFREK